MNTYVLLLEKGQEAIGRASVVSSTINHQHVGCDKDVNTEAKSSGILQLGVRESSCEGQSTRQPVAKEAEHRATQPLELVGVPGL